MRNPAEERRKLIVFAVEALESLFPLAFGLILLMIIAALVG